MDTPCAHSTGIKGEPFFFNAGDITLILGNEFQFEFSVPVSGNIHLKFSILPFQCFGKIPISFIDCLQISFLIIESGFRFHEFLKNIFEAALQECIDICNTVNVVFRNNLSGLFLCYRHKNTPFRSELSYLNSYQKGAIFYQRHKLIYIAQIICDLFIIHIYFQKFLCHRPFLFITDPDSTFVSPIK